MYLPEVGCRARTRPAQTHGTQGETKNNLTDTLNQVYVEALTSYSFIRCRPSVAAGLCHPHPTAVLHEETQVVGAKEQEDRVQAPQVNGSEQSVS